LRVWGLPRDHLLRLPLVVGICEEGRGKATWKREVKLLFLLLLTRQRILVY